MYVLKVHVRVMTVIYSFDRVIYKRFFVVSDEFTFDIALYYSLFAAATCLCLSVIYMYRIIYSILPRQKFENLTPDNVIWVKFLLGDFV